MRRENIQRNCINTRNIFLDIYISIQSVHVYVLMDTFVLSNFIFHINMIMNHFFGCFVFYFDTEFVACFSIDIV